MAELTLTQEEEVLPLKRCPTCPEESQWLPATAEFFAASKQNKDGLYGMCKTCKARREQERYARTSVRAHRRVNRISPEETREQKSAYNRSYYRQNRSRLRAVANAYRSSPEIREQRSIQAKVYYQRPEIRERYLAQKRAYGQTYIQRPEVRVNRRIISANRRARKRAVPGCHTSEQSREQYERQKGRCYWCGQKLTWEKHHEDHVIPLTREGSSNDISNIVIACPHCNWSRKNKLPHEAYQFGRLL